MASRNTGNSRNRKTNPYENFDRYNYVDRDIYSSSSGDQNQPMRRQPSGRASQNSREISSGRGRRRRKSGAKKGFLSFLAVLLVVALVGGGAFLLLTSRMHYEPADTEQYTVLPDDAPAWDVISDKKIVNVLLIGADKNKDGTNGRSDTMMLMSIDTKNKKIRLVSFMRDIYVDIPTVGWERLNAAFAYGGGALTMQTIENYFRIDIDRYVQVDFDGFEEIIDKMGGIDVEISDYEAEFINDKGAFDATAGVNHLDGEDALFFARMRKLDSDFGRTGRQRQVVLAMIDTFKQQNVADMVSLAYAYLPLVTHNLSEGEILQLAGVGAGLSKYDTETMQVPADGTYWDEYATINGMEGNMVLGVDFEANASQLREFLYGETE